MRRYARPGVVAPLGVVLLLLAVAPALAAPVVLQAGATDPAANGWTIQGAGHGMAAGPVFDDLGLQAWCIADNSSAAGSSLAYKYPIDPTDLARAQQIGWILRAEVRLPQFPDAIGDAGSTIFEFADGQRSYRVALGTDDDGDPLVQLVGGPSLAAQSPVAIPDPANSQYHLYELRFNPATGLANLWIDGALALVGYEGVGATSGHILFGSTSDSDTGVGLWHRVEWEVTPVPEPSSFALAAASALGMFLAARALMFRGG